MNEKLDKLRDIGAQRIYEDTHIPIEHVQAIIHESFEGFSKVQFLGFISILEREYGEDLSELRLEGLQYFGDKGIYDSHDSLFVTPKKSKNYIPLYIGLVALIFSAAFYFSMESASNVDIADEKVVDNTLIEDAQKNIIAQENNESNLSISTTQDINSTLEDQNNTQEVAEAITPTLSIIATTKVWIGYIEVATNKHYQKVFTGELELDATKDWLLVFGHAYVDINLNGEVKNFTKLNAMRFLYENGSINPISKKEFKKINKGRLW